MSSEFNADEIFQIAERIEVNGVDFYTRAARLAKDQAARQLLLGLAAMEEGHRQTFATMRSELTEQDCRALTFDPNGESALYLGALANSRVFDAQAKVTLTGKETPTEVLCRAIGLEQESISFYVGMVAMVPGQSGKSRIEDIIREEMRHVVTLTGELVRQRAN